MPANAVRHFLPILLALGALLWMIPGYAAAPQEAASSDALKSVPAADLQSLVETLESPEKRDVFLKTARTALAVQQEQAASPDEPGVGEALFDGLAGTVNRLGQRLGHLSGVIEDAPALLGDVWARLDEPAERQRIVMDLLRLGGVLMAGLAGSYVMARVLRRPRRSLEWHEGAGGLGMRLALLGGRLFLDVLPPLVMLAVSWLAISALQVSGAVLREAVVLMLTAAVLMLTTRLARTLLDPVNDSARVLPLSGETAQYLVIWVRRLAMLAFGGYLVVETASLIGLSSSSRDVLLTILRLTFAALMVVLVLQNRQAVAFWLRAAARPRSDGADTGRGRIGQVLLRRLADIWHVLAVLYIVAFFLVWTAEVAGGFAFMARATVLSVVCVVLAVIAGALAHQGLTRAFSLSEETRQRFPDLERRANRYVPMIGSASNWIIGLIAVLSVAQAWGLDTIVWLTEGAGRHVAGAVMTIGVVLLVALVVWEVVSAWIERYLATEDSEGNAVERSARLKTLLPLARNVILVLLIAVVALIVLSEIGVNIAPLLAGAGVIGLAVGFGSQKLVQDVITGIFILVEDTVSVGDVAVIGGHSGVVEAMTIRSLRLRDVSGNVHTIPFSTVDTITNMTKDFSCYVFEVGIGYREDTDEVTEVLREVGRELQADPEFGPDILEELEVLGVDKFADSAVVIKARLKTRPSMQWMLGREFNRRMKKAFDARDIEIPFPHTTLYFGVDKKGNAPPGHFVVDAPSLPPAPAMPPPVALAPEDVPPTTQTPTPSQD